jgi:hypothetical protein
MLRPVFVRLAAAAALALAATAAPAQVSTIDPNSAVDPQPAPPQSTTAEPGWESDETEYQPVDAGPQGAAPPGPGFQNAAPSPNAAVAAPAAGERAGQAASATIPRNDVFNAARVPRGSPT